MIGKNTVIAILVTFCLTATLFMVVPTRSQTTPTYDPWADINEDGKIDVKDIAYSARLFGTLGDPTKNVTVTNFPTQQETFPENLLLRGTIYSNNEFGTWRSLIDSTTPYPNQNFIQSIIRYDYDYVYKTLNTTATRVYNQTFVYDKYPLRSYKILGRPAVSLMYNVSNSPAVSFSIGTYAELGVISITNQWTTIAGLYGNDHGFTGAFTNDEVPTYFTTHIVSPGFTVNPDERIAVRLIVEAWTNSGTTNLSLYICSAMNSDEFLVDIPIVRNP